MTPDPFRRLGVDRTASAEEVRAARRALAKRVHPDVGGDAREMRTINDAAAAALRLIADRASSEPRDGVDAGTPGAGSGPDAHDAGQAVWERSRRDVPSFTVEALPAETFEALVVAAAALGEVGDDDPPYGLDVLMSVPWSCWCHLSVVPDAGSSTVSLALAPEPGRGLPPLDRVRDAWIAELNALDWSALG